MMKTVMIIIMLLMIFSLPLLFEIKRVEGDDAGWISSTCVHSVHNVYTQLSIHPVS